MIKRWIPGAAAAVFATVLGGAAVEAETKPAPPPAAAPCSGTESRQLDFWVGTWEVAWPASPGTPAGNGTNRIEKILGGCVISENFEARGDSPLIGKSYSTFNVRTRTWQQTWVDNQGSYLDFTGDFADPNEKIFWMNSIGPDGKPVQLRMVFKNIKSDSLDWSWERSTDGGKSWRVQWPIRYTRQKP